ncbi:thiosulfate sulfurtransferase [Scheffersomyces amazonensis]|uniref:thiosulfate sulfurtransferase n=1 Tax=Scheffersomyces amazonensis TaxID=1078765 RepID=UPI00315CB233
MTKTSLHRLSPSAYRALLSSSTPKERVVPIDATWYMPNNPKNAKQEFLKEARLKNAAFFDLDAISLPNSPYPHMLPTYSIFNKAVQDLGIEKNDKLVVYDKSGIFSSPRAAWTFSLFGHPKVYLLDNYQYYQQFRYPVQQTPVSSFATPLKSTSDTTGTYAPITEAEFNQNYRDQVIEYEELLELVKNDQLSKDYYTFDARPNDRFTGKAPEPRPGLSSGHIPSALSLPFSKVINATNKTYNVQFELLKIFNEDFGLDLSNTNFLDGKKGIIVMCGSGVTAVILKVAIQNVIGLDVPIRVYDGSWTEWASRAPKELIHKDF